MESVAPDIAKKLLTRDFANLVVGWATSLLRNKFVSELPPILSGLDATGIQQEFRKAIDEVLTILHQGDD